MLNECERRGTKRKTNTDMGTKTGSFALAALLIPLSAHVVVQLMGNISATVETEEYTGTREGKIVEALK